MEMENVYIMGAVRTAVGKYGGSLKSVPAHTLGALVIQEAIRRAGVNKDWIDEVILGEVRQSTEASNIARCAALEAGLPENVPGFTVNRLCASAMQALFSGCQEIWCGEADVVVAGGTENMSRAPHYLRHERWGDGPLTLVDSNIEAGTTAQPASIYGTALSMPRTAENVAERFRITREEQDRFAAESQRRAAAAIAAGYFKEEILPVEVKEKKKSFVFDTDEFPRPGTTMEVLAGLRPIVKPDGTVTAGNSCGLNDGASAPGVRYPQNHGAHRDDRGADGSGGAERSLCLSGSGLYAGFAAEPGKGQHQRRGNRSGPSPGQHRYPPDRHPAAQPHPYRRTIRIGHFMHRRRSVHGRHHRNIVISIPQFLN